MRCVKPSLGGIALAFLMSACGGLTTQPDSPASQTESTPASPLAGEVQAAQKLYQANKAEQARSQLQALIDAHPKSPEAYLVLAGLELDENHPEAAQTNLDTALALDPNNRRALNQLGIAQRMQGHFQAAEQAYTRALSIDPDYAQAHRNLGILYDLYLGKPLEALKHYQRYQALNGDSDTQIDGWIADLKRRAGTNP
ncbi:MAG: tetratricopeptide repeat protein [Candidatus Thiodiazotropha sp.]|jgi:tetratricopeptide (TPR) repeat protein